MPGLTPGAHRIVITVTGNSHDLAVSCTCLQGGDPIGVRRHWTEGEAYAAWLAHVEQADLAVAS